MDNVQPWSQPGYRQGNSFYPQGGGFQRPFSRPAQNPQKTPSAPGHGGNTVEQAIEQQKTRLNGPSHADLLEAKRLALEAEFSFEGFQVARRDPSIYYPAVTIRPRTIKFNNSCITMLEQATYVQFIIHPTKMLLGIKPCNEGDRDAIRWCNVKDDKRKSRQISCKGLIDKLFDLMGWDKRYYYSMQGFLIHYRGKPVYLFDLKDPTPFVPQHRDPVTGKRIPKVFQYPDGWKNSFGMSVADHVASTDVNLEESFIPVSEEAFE